MTRSTMAGWEPKVAKLEATIESITKDIASLTNAVQGLSSTIGELARNTAEQFEKLAVGLSSASAPKRVDWQVLISGAVLCMTLVGAVIYPITLQIGNLKETHIRLQDIMYEHTMLPLHPIGAAKIDALQLSVDTRFASMTKELDLVRRDGSPITHARLSVLEERFRQLEQARTHRGTP